MSSENEKNVELAKAVEEGNVEAVHELLNQGADPNYLAQDDKTLVELSMKKNYIDIIKLLIQYGATLEKESEELGLYIFEAEDGRRSKELVAHIFKYTKDVELLERFMFFLTFCTNHNEGLDILILLLDLGLPINEYIGEFTEEDDTYTGLHLSVMENRIDFVSIFNFIYLIALY